METLNLKYFDISEFDCKSEKGSGNNMDVRTLKKLDKARDLIENHWNRKGKTRISFIVTSGYRTPEHNKKVGGVKNSAHIKGMAVDLKYSKTYMAFVMVIFLAIVGFNRFGINFKSKFIHVDDDPSKIPFSIWFYKSNLLSVLGLKKYFKTEEDV